VIKRGWSARVVFKYVTLQIPAALLVALGLMLLRRWTGLDAWVVWTALGLWVAKDAVLFPFVWPAYEDRPSNDPFSPVGKPGTARSDLNPRGSVRIKGETWKARLQPGTEAVAAGEEVRVVDRDGLVLIVRRQETGNRDQSTKGSADGQ
jgi:membrane protein implicated in regulation of membrane protease activity